MKAACLLFLAIALATHTAQSQDATPSTANPAEQKVSNGKASSGQPPDQKSASSKNKEADSALTQDGSTMHLNVKDPRPLMAALNALQLKYNWFLDYEDPRYTSPLDITVANDPRYVASPSSNRPHGPNGSTFTFDFPAGLEAAPPDEQKTLSALLDAYNASSNPGKFELKKVDGTFVAVGIKAHDSSGEIAPQDPVLDTPVAIPTGERPLGETISLLLDSISKASKTKINLGVNPRTFLHNKVTKVNGDKRPARVLLYDALASTGKKVTWRLLYDADTKEYFINFHLND